MIPEPVSLGPYLISLIMLKNTWRLNPELPVLAPWRTVQQSFA
jgi:hypothetical protein